MIDLKTLYEQTTMYCELVVKGINEKYTIETYHQPETPIYVLVYWNNANNTIKAITFIIKGE